MFSDEKTYGKRAKLNSLRAAVVGAALVVGLVVGLGAVAGALINTTTGLIQRKNVQQLKNRIFRVMSRNQA